MEIIGRRHYGRKAVPAGGGGGKSATRELLDTLLVWNPRVVLDAQGQAVVKVPLNDALTSFRIVAVADVFDALSHKRCYKDAWPNAEVVKHLREVSGQHLDPQYVELLIANIDKALEINERWPD
eukprot:gene54395-72688_t